ncbi:hypothetical protein GCM10027601_42650 [Nocardioides ungokensis]
MAGLAVGLVYVAANLPAAPASLPTAPAARGSHVDATLSSATTGSLSISPAKYVGGQRLTWSGSVGHAGVRPLVLQFNMGNATGNHWSTVDGFHDQTQADGSFSFTYPAPSMFNIRYRVKAGEYVSAARVFNAKTQDLTIWVTGQTVTNTNAPARVGVDRTFGITVDTTPDNIYRSPESQGLPVLKGRTLTLQQRIDADTWRTLDTTTVGDDGRGYFTGLTAVAGVAVFRVRAEDYVTGGNQIGWAQSFPLYVLAGQTAQDWYSSLYGSVPNSSVPVNKGPSGGAQPPTSSQHYRWFPSLFDFAWEYGQSLSSPPSRGTRIQGSWTDSSTGSGRVSKFNGGLALDSKRYVGAGPGDFGTTRATLHGNSISQGRWETSIRVRNAYERGGHAYQFLVELVPADAADYDCGAHNITVANISPFSDEVGFGVRSPLYSWNGTTTAPYTPLAKAYNVAVEVANGHLTWFLNGSPVGSVTNDAALPGVPLTLRLSLVGQPGAEMDQTGVISDWQRGFPITTGQQVVSHNKLPRRGAAAPDCSAG